MKTIFDINSYLINTLGFSFGLWVLIGAILFALLCLCFLLAVRNGRVKGGQMLREAFWMAVWYFGITGLTAVTFLPDRVNPIWHPGHPFLVWGIAAVVIIALFFWYFLKRKKRFSDRVSAYAVRRSAAGSGAAKYCYALLFGGQLLAFVIAGIRVGCGDSIVHLIVPMAVVVLTLLLFFFTQWKFWLAIGALVIACYAVLVLQNSLTYSNFSFFPSLPLVVLYLSSVLPLSALAFNKSK